MRIDDSPEEDAWFHGVKKLYAFRKWRDMKGAKEGGCSERENLFDDVWNKSQIGEKYAPNKIENGKNGANIDERRSNPQKDALSPDDSTQLRYWVNTHGQQKRTLLHIICRDYLLSDEGLVAELTAGETEGLMDVMQAARTAEMLMRASHNLPVDWNGRGDDETKWNNQSKTVWDEFDEHCMNCPCRFYHLYCPPVKLPPVECSSQNNAKTRQSIWQDLISGRDQSSTEGIRDDFVLHESVLTMTDAMGETPLHLLTGAGSCNVELVKAVVNSCRPLESKCQEMRRNSENYLETVDNDTASFERSNCSTGMGKNYDFNSSSLVDQQIVSSRDCSIDLDHDRRPTIHDLLSIRSGHGCTPLHFVADKCLEDVLVILLKQCPPTCPYYSKKLNSSTAIKPLHPTLIADNDGDLPLHFAANNGASPNILNILTLSMGDKRSALIRNSQGRLAIDDICVWYAEMLELVDGSDENDTADDDDSTDFEVDDIDDEETDLGASSDQECSSNKCVTGDQHDSDILQNYIGLLEKDSFEGMEEDSHCYLARVTISPQKMLLEKFSHLLHEVDAENIPNWRTVLWERMLVFIKAAANSLYPSSSLDHIDPVHAAVLATKYGNFPPIALVASLLADQQPIPSRDSHRIHEKKCFRRMRELCSVISHDYLPLHVACCNKFFIMNELGRNNRHILEGAQKLAYRRCPTASSSVGLDRWDDSDFPFSLVCFLLYLWPSAARTPTKNGRLPLHLALEYNLADDVIILPVYGNILFGSKIERSDIMALLKACPEALHTPDVTTHLYPFQTAAASTSAMAYNLSSEDAQPNTGNDEISSVGEFERAARLISLENTFRLIMEDPSLCRKFGRKECGVE